MAEDESFVERPSDVTITSLVTLEPIPSPTLSKEKISKGRPRRGGIEVRFKVDEATHGLIEKYAEDAALPRTIFMQMLLRQAVKRWQPDLEAGPRRGARKTRTLRETHFWPSGWPRDVGCPWSGCTRPEEHDPAEHPVMTPPLVKAALAALYGPSGIVVKGGSTVRRERPPS